MDIDKIIDDVERYLAQFILYLVSFFRGRRPSEPDAPPAIENNVVIFSILGAVLGAYITRRYGQGAVLNGQGLLDTVIAELLWWISLGVCLYGVMAIAKPRPHMMDCIMVIFRIFPVAFVSCAFISYVAYNVVAKLGQVSGLKDIAANWSATLFELIFITVYLHKGFPPLPADIDKEARRAMVLDRWLGMATVLLVVYARVYIETAAYIGHNHKSLATWGDWLAHNWGSILTFN